MLTDPAAVRIAGAAKEAENREFRRWVSAHRHAIEEFQIIATRVQGSIDCTACAECCRCSVVSVHREDVERIAADLGMRGDEVERAWTEAADGERVLKSSKDGCVFLDGNLCVVYEARPKTCREFPHIAVGEHSLGARWASICRWALVCPILYNAVEEYKRLLGWRRNRAAGGA